MENKSKKWEKVQHSSSKSLWNYTLSPGWNDEEVNILKNALMLFGIGKWRAIINSNCLPGKTIGQIYMQTQRLIGQQSLGDFMGLQVDLQRIYLDNMEKTGVVRKNNSIINTGDNPNKEERKKRILENYGKYKLEEKFIQQLSVPKYKSKLLYQYTNLEDMESKKYSTLEILKNFHFVRNLLRKKIERYDQEKQDYDPSKKIRITLNIQNQENSKSEKQNSNNNNSNKRSSSSQPSLYSFENIQYFEKEQLSYQDPHIITFQRIGAKKLKIIQNGQEESYN